MEAVSFLALGFSAKDIHEDGQLNETDVQSLQAGLRLMLSCITLKTTDLQSDTESKHEDEFIKLQQLKETIEDTWKDVEAYSL